MHTQQRKYDLRIWGLGLGFYLFYTPYSGLTKALSSGLLGTNGPVRGPVLLPISAVATVIGMFGFITAMKWWKYAGRHEFFGISVPFPRRLTFLSGVCMATIMGTTTLAFTFGGLSIVSGVGLTARRHSDDCTSGRRDCRAESTLVLVGRDVCKSHGRFGCAYRCRQLQTEHCCRDRCRRLPHRLFFQNYNS